MEKSVFHQMPEFVEVFVVLPLVFAIFLGRNDHLHLFLPCLLDNRVGIVGSIPQEILGIDTLYKGRSLRAIRRRPFCDQNPNRHAVCIHGQMDLGVEPPFVFSMSWLPPTAPAA